MKRFLLAIFFFFTLSFPTYAHHIIGGEMRYTYVSPGVSPNSNIYNITLILFRGDDPNGAQMPVSVIIGIYNNDNGQKVIGDAGPTNNDNWLFFRDNPPDVLPVPIILPPCISSPPVINFTYAYFSHLVELPSNISGYTVVYQTCCREDIIQNVPPNVGANYNCLIPGTSTVSSGIDSSPQFGIPINVICKFSPFILDFSATDSDNDSLVYSFCDAYDGGGAANSGYNNPGPPPYNSVPYQNGYTGSQPLGSTVTINPHTGIISGIAPGVGDYVVCVCIDVFRNGVRIAGHRKDLIVRISDCSTLLPQVKPNDKTCDGFTRSFQNINPSPLILTYFWDFGVPGILSDTSNLPNPVYTYPDTGVYVVKLVVNRNQQCSDSSTTTIKVYPGFFPGFIFAGGCVTKPFQFNDTTKTNYGLVDSWSWDFGDGATFADTSHLQNPQWTYSSPGIKTVTLIVSNSKGCIDTVAAEVDVIAKPVITLGFNDILICIPDSITLNASGTGTFSWTPNIRIINANTATPTVYPIVDTWYVANLDDNGCMNKDSVHVRVTSGVSLLIRPDTTICLGDPVQLTTTTNGLAFQWTPAATLNNPTIASPIATPVDPVTTYQVLATVGSCFKTGDVTIRTVPYPLADAGPPQLICYNKSAQLNASIVGNSFSWSPTKYLNDSAILNPVSTPPRTTAYILTVYDNKGCPKPGRDTVVVTVNPKVRAYAGRDTSVVVRQPLQLGASGGVTYQWNPSIWLNNPSIPNPIAVFPPGSPDSVLFKVVVKDNIGCPDTAKVTVYIFQTAPSIFVPTAFTPNGDGLNDVVRPISVGMRKIIYFSVYNRWGELVFTTTEDRKGWDGRIGGVLQSSNVFVWMVSAEDYLGNKYFRKGTVALIR